MKNALNNAWISALLYGAIATAVPTFTVQPVDAAQFSPPGAFNNSAEARRATASNTESMLATSRANSSARTPAEQILRKSHANAYSAEVETTRQLNQQQTTGATTP
jgi:hypothetical protein